MWRWTNFSKTHERVIWIRVHGVDFLCFSPFSWATCPFPFFVKVHLTNPFARAGSIFKLLRIERWKRCQRPKEASRPDVNQKNLSPRDKSLNWHQQRQDHQPPASPQLQKTLHWVFWVFQHLMINWGAVSMQREIFHLSWGRIWCNQPIGLWESCPREVVDLLDNTLISPHPAQPRIDSDNVMEHLSRMRRDFWVDDSSETSACFSPFVKHPWGCSIQVRSVSKLCARLFGLRFS